MQSYSFLKNSYNTLEYTEAETQIVDYIYIKERCDSFIESEKSKYSEEQKKEELEEQEFARAKKSQKRQENKKILKVFFISLLIISALIIFFFLAKNELGLF